MSTCSYEAGRTSEKPFIHDGDLQEVLCERTSLQIIIVRRADTSEKTHRARPPKIELKKSQHIPLGFKNFVDAVTIVDHVHNLADRRAIDLLVFRGDEDGRGTYKL